MALVALPSFQLVFRPEGKKQIAVVKSIPLKQMEARWVSKKICRECYAIKSIWVILDAPCNHILGSLDWLRLQKLGKPEKGFVKISRKRVPSKKTHQETHPANVTIIPKAELRNPEVKDHGLSSFYPRIGELTLKQEARWLSFLLQGVLRYFCQKEKRSLFMPHTTRTTYSHDLNCK